MSYSPVFTSQLPPGDPAQTRCQRTVHIGRLRGVNLEGTFPSFSFILLSDPVTAGRGGMRVNITVQSSQSEGLKAHVGVVVNDFVII